MKHAKTTAAPKQLEDQIDGAYSYARGKRVSEAFWRSLYAEMAKRGWSHREIVEFIYSKHTRWMLDEADGMTTKSGAAMVADYLGRKQGVLKEVRIWIEDGASATINENGDTE